MLVYVAYGLLVVHVAFGVLQAELSPIYVAAVGVGMLTIFSLHLAAAMREIAGDRDLLSTTGRATVNSESSVISSVPEGIDGFIYACSVNDIPEKRAKIICLSGERVAIFKYDGKISAVSNVCQHQNGPLGEGKILDGCITCPWHGYQYRPETGASPPPFVEKVPTFNVRVKNGRVHVHSRPNPAGTPAEPALIWGIEEAGSHGRIP